MITEDANNHTYRALGESGLVEDEEGNIYNASEVDDSSEQQKPAEFNNFGVSSALDDKTNPAYWYFYYDERYCGPSREAYMEKMALQYRKKAMLNQQEGNVSVAPEAKTPPKEDKSTKEPRPAANVNKKEDYIEKAEREQKALERDGLHPTFRKDRITEIYGLNFLAVVNRYGEKIVTNKDYLDVGIYLNSLARALSKKTKRFGFIDRHGKEVIPCTWRSAGEFSEYMAVVQDDNRRSGFVDVTGRLRIPCTWVETWPFHEGLARVQDENRRIGMIDHDGHLIIPCKWKGMGDFSEGLAGVRDDDGKCGYIDKTGEIVIPCRWKQVWTFCEGRAVVQDFNKRVGFIDKTGKLVIPCIWKKVSYFKNGVARATNSKRFFFKNIWVNIDKYGNIIK